MYIICNNYELLNLLLPDFFFIKRMYQFQERVILGPKYEISLWILLCTLVNIPPINRVRLCFPNTNNPSLSAFRNAWIVVFVICVFPLRSNHSSPEQFWARYAEPTGDRNFIMYVAKYNWLHQKLLFKWESLIQCI